MNITKYLSLSYDHRNKKGVNCWGLYALVRHNEFNDNVASHGLTRCSNEEIAAAYAIVFAKYKDVHTEVTNPENYDLIVLSIKDTDGKMKFHCGVYWEGRMLHAKGTARSGQVWYDELKDYKDWNIRFFRYDN